MDDSSFDKIIKDKVGEYTDPVYDPSALASLHHAMATVSNVPWFVRFRTELITGFGVAACAAMIFLGQYYAAIQRPDSFSSDQAALLAERNEQIAGLKDQISQLSGLIPDTIVITEVQYRDNSSYYYCIWN